MQNKDQRLERQMPSSLEGYRIHLSEFYHSTLTLNDKMSDGRQYNEVQGIISRLIPDISNLFYSIEALLTSGYLLPAELLLRGALDRLGTISYIVNSPMQGVPVWQRGWLHKERPNLRSKLKTLNDQSSFLSEMNLPDQYLKDSKLLFLELVNSLNGAIHGDYTTAMSQVSKNDGTFDYYRIGPDHENQNYIENISLVSTWVLIHLAILLKTAFPNVFLKKAA
jgi:hypothetical protein